MIDLKRESNLIIFKIAAHDIAPPMSPEGHYHTRPDVRFCVDGCRWFHSRCV